jgi:hypothetical protein
LLAAFIQKMSLDDNGSHLNCKHENARRAAGGLAIYFLLVNGFLLRLPNTLMLQGACSL